jgi:hypothetical protein
MVSTHVKKFVGSDRCWQRICSSIAPISLRRSSENYISPSGKYLTLRGNFISSTRQCLGNDLFFLSMVGMTMWIHYDYFILILQSGASTNPRKPLPRWTRIFLFFLKLLFLAANSARSSLNGPSLFNVPFGHVKFSKQLHRERICSWDAEFNRACWWIGWEIHKSSTNGLCLI